MDTETFIIKSIYIQNTIMLWFLGLAISFLLYSILKKRRKHIVVSSIWVLLVLWFFNSPFFGFSAVSVSPEGIKLNYGILSIRNEFLPIDSKWEVNTYLSGIRKNKKLYYIAIGGHQSMKVKGLRDFQLLEKIGQTIERMKKGKWEIL